MKELPEAIEGLGCAIILAAIIMSWGLITVGAAIQNKQVMNVNLYNQTQQSDL